MMTTGVKILAFAVLMASSTVWGNEPNQTTDPMARQSSHLRRQIEMQRFSAIESNQSKTDALKDIIAQIQSLGQMSAETAAAGNKPAGNEKHPAAAPEPAAVSASMTTTTNKGAEPTQVTLDKVGKPVNPMAAADVLYRAKDYEHAARFYQLAMEANTAKKPSDQQWALFQLGNSLRRQNPDKAVEWYQKLITEYPNSPWTAAAMSQRKNLEWLKQNQPASLQQATGNDPNRR